MPPLRMTRRVALFVDAGPAGPPVVQPRPGQRGGRPIDRARTSTASRSRSNWRRPGSHADAAADPGRPGRPVRAAGAGAARRPAPAADAGRIDRLEPRPARRVPTASCSAGWRSSPGRSGWRPRRRVCAGRPVEAGEVLASLGRLVDKSLVMAEEHAARRATGCWRRSARSRRRGWRGRRGRRPARPAPRLVPRLAEAAEPRGARRRPVAAHVLRRSTPTCARRSTGASRRRTPTPGGGWRRRWRGCGTWTGAAARGWRTCGGPSTRAPDDRSRLQARLLDRARAGRRHRRPARPGVRRGHPRARAGDGVGDGSLRALCLKLAAVGAFYTDFDAGVGSCATRRPRGARRAGNGFDSGGARALQAMILHLRDRHAEAEALADASAGRPAAHRGVRPRCSASRRRALATGDPARALELAEEAVRLAEPLGDYLRVGIARSVLGCVNALTGDRPGGGPDRSACGVSWTVSRRQVFMPGWRTMGLIALSRAATPRRPPPGSPPRQPVHRPGRRDLARRPGLCRVSASRSPPPGGPREAAAALSAPSRSPGGWTCPARWRRPSTPRPTCRRIRGDRTRPGPAARRARRCASSTGWRRLRRTAWRLLAGSAAIRRVSDDVRILGRRGRRPRALGLPRDARAGRARGVTGPGCERRSGQRYPARDEGARRQPGRCGRLRAPGARSPGPPGDRVGQPHADRDARSSGWWPRG